MYLWRNQTHPIVDDPCSSLTIIRWDPKINLITYNSNRRRNLTESQFIKLKLDSKFTFTFHQCRSFFPLWSLPIDEFKDFSLRPRDSGFHWIKRELRKRQMLTLPREQSIAFRRHYVVIFFVGAVIDRGIFLASLIKHGLEALIRMQNDWFYLVASKRSLSLLFRFILLCARGSNLIQLWLMGFSNVCWGGRFTCLVSLALCFMNKKGAWLNKLITCHKRILNNVLWTE